VRLAALDLRENPGWIQGISEPETVIPEFSGFSLNSPVLTFLHEYHLFCVNYVEFMFMVRNGINACYYSGYREHFRDAPEPTVG